MFDKVFLDYHTGHLHYLRGNEYQTLAIEAFKKSAMIHPFDENHLSELEAKLKEGSFKLQQESIAFMGCAAVHLNEMIHGLDEDEKQEVPVDESLMSTFKDW